MAAHEFESFPSRVTSPPDYESVQITSSTKEPIQKPMKAIVRRVHENNHDFLSEKGSFLKKYFFKKAKKPTTKL